MTFKVKHFDTIEKMNLKLKKKSYVYDYKLFFREKVC